MELSLDSVAIKLELKHAKSRFSLCKGKLYPISYAEAPTN
jgi:hypothetical protein